MRVLRTIGLVGIGMTISCGRESAQLAPAVSTHDAASPGPSAPSLPPKPTLVTDTISVAAFAGDNMTTCSSVTVKTAILPPEKAAKWLTPRQLSLLVLDELLTAQKANGDGVLGREGDGAHLIMQLVDPRLFAEAKKDSPTATTPAKANDKKTKAPASTPEEQRAAFVASIDKEWPPQKYKDAVTKGALMKVETCDVPGKVALASCTVGDRSDNGEWSGVQTAFSVDDTVDSDAAFKRCAKMHGKWSALDPTSDAVQHEKLRQHALQLKKAADPAELEKHMRALRRAAEGE